MKAYQEAMTLDKLARKPTEETATAPFYPRRVRKFATLESRDPGMETQAHTKQILTSIRVPPL